MKHMKSILVVTCIFVTVVLGLAIRGIDSQIIESTPQVNERVLPQNILSQTEINELKILTNQTLLWIKIWEPKPWRCKTGEELNMPEIFDSLEGKEVEMRIKKLKNNFTVYLISLHLKFDVKRTENSALGIPSVEYFCEDTYEARIAVEKQNVQQMQRWKTQVEKHSLTIPNPTILENRRYAKSLKEENKEIQTMESEEQAIVETKFYKVPKLDSNFERNQDITDQKRDLYEQIAFIIQNQAEQFYCASNERIKAVIPEFNIGDPAIYILIKSPNSIETSVAWLNFTRNGSTKDFSVYFVKDIELPKDRVNYLSSTIISRQINEFYVDCSQTIEK